ncbi:MAG: hypothetical protein ACT4PZ_07065 [Panacagrimonas sp.]
MLRNFLVALTLLATTAAAFAQAKPPIRMIDETDMPAAERDAMMVDYEAWALRVYRYLHVADPLPVNLVVSRRVRIGYYARPNVYVPAVTDEGEMLETWVHELSHHATGHDSTFFFKEGIASHTLEALFLQDGRVPQGFPQYGQTNDAWVSLFDRSGELPALTKMMELDSYDAASRESDFRSWQVYIVGASFVGWLIRNEGFDTFAKAFASEELGPRAAEWERRWLKDVRAQSFKAFAPVEQLPDRARYRYYADRLKG